MLWAYDFDLGLNFYNGYGNLNIEENEYDFKIGIVPRFFLLIDGSSEVVATAGLTFDPDNIFVPELLHTEYSRRFGNYSLRLGRFIYSDPLSFIFEGLFDGAQFSNVSPIGIFNVGVWYTGLIYKNTTIIEMTRDDFINCNTPLDYSDFFNTYSASKRFVFSAGWEHPSLAEFMQLNTAFITQFDLNDYDEQYNSQYLIFKGRIPVNNFTYEFGGSIESIARKTDGSSEPMEIALAAEVGLLWLFPGEYDSRLSANFKIAGGGSDGFMDAFVPITSKYYGFILKHRMAGISILSLNYSTRLSRVLGGSLDASYFVRNDLGTFTGYPLITDNDSEKHFLGPEFSGRLIWSPVSDIQFNLGGGLFIPALGNAEPDQKIKWRVDLTAIFAF